MKPVINESNHPFTKTMSVIKIGVAEDQQIFRNGLVALLNSFAGIEVTSEAENGHDLANNFGNHQPDIIILNHNMPLIDGIETTKEIKLKFPLIKIILLSAHVDDNNILSAIENGANGFLSKNDGQHEIEKAIHGVLQNNYYINDRVSNILINNMMIIGKINPSFVSSTVQFTPDELKILTMISKEYTTQQIAIEICKSTRTVEKYRTKMLMKVGAQNTVGLIMYAIKNKIIEI